MFLPLKVEVCVCGGGTINYHTFLLKQHNKITILAIGTEESIGAKANVWFNTGSAVETHWVTHS